MINLYFLLILDDTITVRYHYVFILFSLLKTYNFVSPCVLGVVNRCDREWPKTNPAEFENIVSGSQLSQTGGAFNGDRGGGATGLLSFGRRKRNEYPHSTRAQKIKGENHVPGVRKWLKNETRSNGNYSDNNENRRRRPLPCVSY